MKTITEQLADALRVSEGICANFGDKGNAASAAAAKMARDALAAYDAQRAAPAESDADIWRCDDGEFITKRGTYGPMQVACVDSPEDAARIVACVNACHGMTLAEVESFGSPGELGRCAQLWASDDGEEVTP